MWPYFKTTTNGTYFFRVRMNLKIYSLQNLSFTMPLKRIYETLGSAYGNSVQSLEYSSDVELPTCPVTGSYFKIFHPMFFTGALIAQSYVQPVPSVPPRQHLTFLNFKPGWSPSVKMLKLIRNDQNNSGTMFLFLLIIKQHFVKLLNDMVWFYGTIGSQIRLIKSEY